MLRASAMRSAPCRASRSSPSMGTPLRLCARAELLRAPATAPKPTLSLPICTPPPRAVFVAPDAMLRRLYSTGPKKPASAPTPASSSHSTNHVDLLSKYEERAERKQRFVRWSTVLLALLAIAALILWYMEGHRASKDILETVGALSEQGAPNSKEPPVYHLRKLYERARTNEHWMQAVQAESVGLLEILRPYLDSKDKDERIYASLLVSYIAAGSRTQKKAVIDGGYVDVMLKYTDTPTRVATILTLSRIAEKWFAGEMKSIFRDNAAISKFINDCSEEHEPLLQAYAKRILYNTGSKSLGRQLSASNDLLIKAFDYTQKTDKESMAKAIKDAVDGEPKNAYFQFCQAYWFHLMGFAKEAKIAYTKSLGINQGQVDALYELGRIYLVEFHPDRTAILWSRALQENPNFPPLVKWLDDFEARKDNTRDDLVSLHRTLTALRTGSDVSVAKAAPLLPAELPGAAAATTTTQPSALQSVAAAVVPALGAGPRPQHTPPPPAAQQQQQQ